MLVVIIYPNKLEITNTGASPYKQSELKKNHLSMPFNPDIAHMAFLRGYMEKIGRGTILLTPIATKEGNRVPDYKEITDLPDTSMERYIKQLKDGGLIEFRGEAAHTGGDYLDKEDEIKIEMNW